MRNFLHRLMTEEEGATMVEYALMVALIAAVALAAAAAIGTNTKSTFETVSGKITAPAG